MIELTTAAGQWVRTTDQPPYFFAWVEDTHIEETRGKLVDRAKSEMKREYWELFESLNRLLFNALCPGGGKTELTTESVTIFGGGIFPGANGTTEYLFIVVIPTHNTTESADNFEDKLLESAVEFKPRKDFRHVKAKQWAACPMCKRYDPKSERDEHGRIVKEGCEGCDKILCDFPLEYVKKLGRFPGCGAAVSTDPSYAAEMMVNYTRYAIDKIMGKLADLMRGYTLKDYADTMFELEKRVGKRLDKTKAENRGEYEYETFDDRDGNLASAKLVCRHYTKCKYQKQFHGCSNLSCVITPFKMLPKMLREIEKQRNAAMKKAGGNYEDRKSDKIVVVFDDSIEKDIFEELGFKPTDEDLVENNVKLDPIPVRIERKRPMEHPENVKIKKEQFYWLRLKRPVQVHDQFTKELADFFESHEKIIYHKGRRSISGKQKVDFLNDEHVVKIIYNCGTTQLPAVEKMTGLADWHVIGKGVISADDLPNPLVVVDAKSWGKRQFTTGSNANDSARIIAHTLRVTRDRGKRIFVLTKKGYISRKVKGEVEDGVLKAALKKYCTREDLERVDFVWFGKARGTNEYGFNDYVCYFLVGIYDYTPVTKFVLKKQGLDSKDVRGLPESEMLNGLHRGRQIYHPDIPIVMLSRCNIFSQQMQRRAKHVKLNKVLQMVESSEVPFWEKLDTKKAKSTSAGKQQRYTDYNREYMKKYRERKKQPGSASA